MKRFLLFLILAALAGGLIGCGAPIRWCHADKGLGDFERDRFECEAAATAMTHQSGFTGNPLIMVDYWQRCMRSRGWQQCGKMINGSRKIGSGE